MKEVQGIGRLENSLYSYYELLDQCETNLRTELSLWNYEVTACEIYFPIGMLL